MKKKMAQIGTFDVKNYGDLLFPYVLANVFRDVDIDLFSPTGGEMPFESLNVYPLSSLNEMCAKNNYSVIIIGGGDLIRIDNSIVSDYKKNSKAALSLWLYPCLIGKKNNIPVVFNAPGVPFYFNSAAGKMISQILTYPSYISVRDKESKHILEYCNIKNINVVPDTVLYISKLISLSKLKSIKSNLNNRDIANIDNYVVIQHNKTNIEDKHHIEVIKKLISIITNEYNLEIVLLPIGYVHGDIQFLKKIYNPKNKKVHFVVDELSPLEMLSVLANSVGYIGTSLHGTITTYTYGKAVLPININRNVVKVHGFMEHIKETESEVADIDNLISLFKTKFINYHFNIKRYNSLIKILEKHFDNIRVSMDKSINTDDFEINLLSTMFDTIENYSKLNLDIANIYIDDGTGLHEYNKEKVKFTNNEGNFILDIVVPEGTKAIRIDPIENSYVLFKKLSLKDENNNDIDYIIPNLVDIDSIKLINSTDPQIIIQNVNFKKLKLVSNIHVVQDSDLEILTNNILSKDDIINNDNKNINELNSILDYAYNHPFKYLVKRIFGQFK